MPTIETNFDAIPGPTHNYGGLSPGNLASLAHSNQPSNPRQAALQGLEKMKFLADLGLSQAVLPPHERPDIRTLRKLGFTGSDSGVLAAAAAHHWLLASCASASSMWAANAATISPSTDAADGRLHLTPANLASQFHRSLEAKTTTAILKKIFPDESAFVHHSPLPSSPRFFDEGAANHMRLAPSHGDKALEIFVYGRRASDAGSLPARFPARQSLEASESIARLHRLEAADVVFLQQNPAAIDAGAFHNDVVAVANENVLLYHAAAFTEPIAQKIRFWFAGRPVHLIEVSEAQVPLADAIASYLFNSQIVTVPDGTMALIAPAESCDNPVSRKFLEGLPAKNTPIQKVHFVDVRQSMNNGGGPACLRLRVQLTDHQRALTNPAIFLTSMLHETLRSWVIRHYRDCLTPADLADPKLLDESRRALDELSGILNLGSVYPFQQK